MKLAEALIERKRLKEKADGLKERIEELALVQEGDQAAEDPTDLLAKWEQAVTDLEVITRRIHKTNMAALLEGKPIADYVLRRDMLKMRHQAYTMLSKAATPRHERFGRNEVKYVAELDSALMRETADENASAWRALDVKLQAQNWATDLV